MNNVIYAKLFSKCQVQKIHHFLNVKYKKKKVIGLIGGSIAQLVEAPVNNRKFAKP